MKRFTQQMLIIFVALLLLGGCASYRAQEIVPTSMIQAQEEIPEDELLDVGITVFEDAELTEEEAKDQGTHPDIRKAESHFIPYHLKNTLQRSSHWGAVRVIPSKNAEVDLLVEGKILESNGERLILTVKVTDAAGKLWMEKTYRVEATSSSYDGNRVGTKEAFQDLYTTIANDMAAAKEGISHEGFRNIRTISKLQFAADFAPDAFGDYLTKDQKGKTAIRRLPADDDPMMKRLLQIRTRDHMYVDTLNEYYDGFYNDMWTPYENWRKANRIERTALREMKRSAYMRQAAGALMVVLAIALDSGNTDISPMLRDLMIIGGGAVIIDGYNVSKEAEIHRAALQELSESFGSEMRPVVMEFQGKKYELSGSAEEQYAHWRELLRKIYYTETGFHEPGDAEMDSTADK